MGKVHASLLSAVPLCGPCFRGQVVGNRWSHWGMCGWAMHVCKVGERSWVPLSSCLSLILHTREFSNEFLMLRLIIFERKLLTVFVQLQISVAPIWVFSSPHLLGRLGGAADVGHLQDANHGLWRAAGALILVTWSLVIDTHLHAVSLLCIIRLLCNQPASHMPSPCKLCHVWNNSSL